MKHFIILFLTILIKLYSSNYKILSKNVNNKYPVGKTFVLYFYDVDSNCDYNPLINDVNNIVFVCIEYFEYGTFNRKDLTIYNVFENIKNGLDKFVKDFGIGIFSIIYLYGKGLGGIISRAYFSKYINNRLNITKFIIEDTPNMGFTEFKKDSYLKIFFDKTNFLNFLNVDKTGIKDDILKNLNNLNGKNKEFPYAKEFFLKLKSFITVYFTEDNLYLPKTSPFFEYYENNELKQITDKDHVLFQEDDKLGLKKLDDENKIIFVRDVDMVLDKNTIEGIFLSYESKNIRNYIFEKFHTNRKERKSNVTIKFKKYNEKGKQNLDQVKLKSNMTKRKFNHNQTNKNKKSNVKIKF